MSRRLWIIEFSPSASGYPLRTWFPVATQEGLNQSGLSDVEASTFPTRREAKAALAKLQRDRLVNDDTDYRIRRLNA